VLRKLVLALTVAGLLSAGVADAAAKPAKKGKPSPTAGVVLIDTDLALAGGSAAGTGIVLTKAGEVLTNNHVIRGATSITVTVPGSGKSYPADVVGYDVSDDVALIQLHGATNLATATFGDSARLKLGLATRAVGNAEGAGKLVQTVGKVTGLDQTIQVQDDYGDVRRLSTLVRTSARLVPGDSGGPLLDAATNKVIGMDAAGSANFQFNTNTTGYAIAIDKVVALGKQIATQKASPLVHIGATAFIGIGPQDTPNGIVVQSVVPGSPAARAGLQPGDDLTSLDGTALATSDDLRTLLFQHHPGESVTLGYADTTGLAHTAPITLAAGPPQ
jgi:S1-C subfamily serine protease